MSGLQWNIIVHCSGRNGNVAHLYLRICKYSEVSVFRNASGETIKV